VVGQVEKEDRKRFLDDIKICEDQRERKGFFLSNTYRKLIMVHC